VAGRVHFIYHPAPEFPRQFKANPRLLAKARGMYYWTPEGRQILDAVAGLWCVNAGHGRREIAQAVASQLETLGW